MTLFALTAQAGVEVVQFKDPVNAQRYHNLVAELRCLVCQNQNLADSNADLAKDLRTQVSAMIKAGSTDSEITDYMVNRYGDFVLYRPPFKSSTLFIWLGPLFVVVGAIFVLVVFIRRQRNKATVNISAENQERVRHLLQDNDN
jgi:cytochrome c-type biogenesis protein CcmH